ACFVGRTLPTAGHPSARLVAMSVIDIRLVRMAVHEPSVSVRVRVAVDRLDPLGVLMVVMRVVHVGMLVGLLLVSVQVRMASRGDDEHSRCRGQESNPTGRCGTLSKE